MLKQAFFFFLLSFSLCAEDLRYTLIENQATIPLLNPSLAERKIGKIKLSNGLEAYLISDSQAEKSAASIIVEVGSWNDPKEYPGTAHFCEHMLFMGSQKYPEETEYWNFILDHGGSTNAYTAPDHTAYMFSINHETFKGALDRFSRFFIDPLFSHNAIQRELLAVDQEHGKNIENDGWREYMVFKEVGNPLHPNASFSTGNAETLSAIPQSTLIEWYKNHYSADRMHLVIISPLSVEELIPLAVQTFSSVPLSTYIEKEIPEELLSSQQKGHFIYIKPIRDLRTLTLLWQPPIRLTVDLERQPFALIAYCLNNSTANGLLAHLKKEGVAESLRAEFSSVGRGQAFFQISIDLTEEGIGKIDAVIERTFQTLALLKTKGIPKSIFEEKQKIDLINYQYQSRQNPFQFMYKTASTIIHEDLSTYPEKTYLLTTYNAKCMEECLNVLTPDNCTFSVQADPQLTRTPPTNQEKWMKAEYTIKEIPSAHLASWRNLKPHPQMGLPPHNPYIPQKLTLVLSSSSDITPVLIAEEAGCKIYYAQDTQYKLPTVSCTFGLKSPLFDGSAKANALTELYLYALKETLYTPLALASDAGISLQSGIQDLNIVFSLSGYDDKSPLLLETLFKTLPHVYPTQEQFEIYKHSLLSAYDNFSKELPYAQAQEILKNTLYNTAPLGSAKHAALQRISYAEFCTFCKKFFEKSYVEGMIYGNLTTKEAQNLWSQLTKAFHPDPYLPRDHHKKKILLLPEGKGPFLISKNTERQGNGVILLLQEGSFSFEKRASQQILSKALRQPFFDTLRTKQQTAYIAHSLDLEKEKQLFQFFIVQSLSHQPQELLARFELFLEDFNRNIRQNISPERFEVLKVNLIQDLQAPLETQQDMMNRLNLFAFTHDGDFQWMAKRIEAIQNLSYEQLLRDAHSFLSRENLKRLAVLVEGTLPLNNTFRYAEVGQDEIKALGLVK